MFKKKDMHDFSVSILKFVAVVFFFFFFAVVHVLFRLLVFTCQLINCLIQPETLCSAVSHYSYTITTEMSEMKTDWYHFTPILCWQTNPIYNFISITK